MNPLETYLKEMRDNRATGQTVAETSFYPVLANLFNEIGKGLKPKVRCVINIANRGAGIPDGGMFTADQIKKDDPNPIAGELPARGVLEVKGPGDEVRRIAQTKQVKDYLSRYGLVLVTNYRDFLLLGRDTLGRPLPQEGFTLSKTEEAFWRATMHPHIAAGELGEQFCEYLKRVMLSNAPLSAPQDVAWFLASYARDAKARVENHKDLSALAAVREALEDALGMKFTGDKGEHFFRSTLVQTIFYGVFSAWVLWHREQPGRGDTFDWRVSAWSLRVPFIRALYDEVATPSKLGPLGLVEVLDWTAAALNRVDRAAFFQRFQDEHAVQYFYEPFLEAFDPELRKELGVWYTPPEIVKYQVARVDAVLREELGLADGLADPNVVVLDPCCGTGAYLVEVLKKIAETLKEKGGDALLASDLKKAATTRVFGFEILPSPFVVSHLQLGLMLHDLGAPLSTDKSERVGVYLTNSLTGWEPPKEPKNLLFPELQAERDAADSVKRDKQILVILGNPPYNGFAGIAVAEERELSNAYRTTENAPKPRGQGLNDLFVRFFRMAERRIVEKSGKGVVCFISNYAWLEGLSFTGMRERYLEAFDQISIDCLNGDKYMTGKVTPDGKPDPSVFSTDFNHEGIQVGTSIALLVRKQNHQEANFVRFRHFWGHNKRGELLESLTNGLANRYEELTPPVVIGFPFTPTEVAQGYMAWPRLPSLLPTSFPGVKTARDGSLVSIDESRLRERIVNYFDANRTDAEVALLVPELMDDDARFNGRETRLQLVKRGINKNGFIRYYYRPLDLRWLYWEPQTKLLDEKRSEYLPHVVAGNPCMILAQRTRKGFCPPAISCSVASYHVIESMSLIFPLRLRANANLLSSETNWKANVSPDAEVYVDGLAASSDSIFYHILAILHSSVYCAENAAVLRQDWPRIPLPDSRKALEASAELGSQVAALLDTESDVPGVTASPVGGVFRTIGVLSRVGGGMVNEGDGELAVTAGWGHAGKDGVTMPARGRIVQRAYDKAELDAIAEAAKSRGLSGDEARGLLGEDTRDVYLSDKAYWRNIPAGVWEYFIGGYQVIKKWLSYRERELLGRALSSDEVREVMNMARRLAAIVLMQPALDENYRRVAGSAYAWPGGKSSTPS